MHCVYKNRPLASQFRDNIKQTSFNGKTVGNSLFVISRASFVLSILLIFVLHVYMSLEYFTQRLDLTLCLTQGKISFGVNGARISREIEVFIRQYQTVDDEVRMKNEAYLKMNVVGSFKSDNFTIMESSNLWPRKQLNVWYGK